MSDADNVIPFPHGRRPRRSRAGEAATRQSFGPRQSLGFPDEHTDALRALQQLADSLDAFDDADGPDADDDDGVLEAPWARRPGRPGLAPTGFGALDAYGPLAGPGRWDGFAGPARRRPELLARPAQPVAFVVRLDLDGAKPPVWRRLRLAGELTLDRVHEAIQLAMGWSDSHLHHFLMGPKTRDWRAEPFLSDYDVAQGEPGVAESAVRLDQVVAEPGDRLFYEYDFGDSWHHTLKVERVEPQAPGERTASCLDGRRACPPENVGGVGGYALILQALAGRVDPEDAEWLQGMLSTLPGFDPAAFDAARTDRELELAGQPVDLARLTPGAFGLLAALGASPLTETGRLCARALADARPLDAEAAAAATSRYRGLLDAVGDGIALTAAGYLPPKLVEQLYRGLDLDDGWYGKGNREDQTYPVHALRSSATALGLVRKNRGRLLPTKAGRALAGDPAGLLRHIADRLPLGRDAEQPAGIGLLLVTAGGEEPYAAREEIAQLLVEAGWVFTGPDPGLTAFRLAGATREVLQALTGPSPAPGVRAATAQALLLR